MLQKGRFLEVTWALRQLTAFCGASANLGSSIRQRRNPKSARGLRYDGAGHVVKGCALSLLLSVCGLAVSVIGLAAALRTRYGLEWQDVAGVAALGGLGLWIAANLAKAAVVAWRERTALLAGLSGTPPVDGRRAILTGRIEPLGPTLRAPLSGRYCVAYTFEAYEWRRIGRSRSKVMFCGGIALTPSTVATPAGPVRLLAVPHLDCDDTILEHASALRQTLALMQTLPFDPSPKGFSGPGIEAQWTDDDGEFKREHRYVERIEDVEKCRMAERCIEAGVDVCVFGQYSAARQAIVPDPRDWSKITRVMKGTPDAIVRQLRRSVVRRTAGALVTAGAAAAIVAAFVSSLG